MERTLVALWFADIAGYSSYAATDETAALSLVQTLQELSRQTVPHFGGRIVKFLGDGVLAQFSSAELAVRAAKALSARYHESVLQSGIDRNLRIGVHLADVAVGTDGDLYGDGVNAAARIQQAAAAGQVLVSQDVWRQLRGRKEFRFEPLGERVLKGVGSMELYVTELEGNTKPATSSTTIGMQPIRSVAVLPFADLSPQRDQEYFGDGLAEEILNALTKLRSVRVPARSSCFAFRGSNLDVRDVGRRLGVDALLEGSIRKAGERIRISVQLIDARDGYQRWSERFDREIADVFAIQEEIATSVVSALGISSDRRDVRQLIKQTTANVEAYEFYLRGRKLFQTWTRQNIALAREMFERAVAIDPDFAAAWAGLATTHVHLHGCDNESHLDKAREASAHALKLVPQSAEAHLAAGQGLSMEKRYGDAAAEFEQAIELDPTLFDAHYYYARSCFKSGELEKSLRLFRQAESVRPEDHQAIYLEALVLTQLGRHAEARQAYERGFNATAKHIELNSDDARAIVLGAVASARLGESVRAKEWAERAMLLAPDDDAILYNAGCALAVLGEHENALDALKCAIDAGLAGGDWITQDPDWAQLRERPKFQELIQRLTRRK